MRRTARRIGVLLAGFGLAAAAPAAPSGAWVKLPTVPYTLNNKQDAISFVDARRGWYGNGVGRVYATTDGGAHWRLAWSKPGAYVRALAMLDARRGVMGNVAPGYFPDVTDPQPLYVTADGGAHWTAAKTGGARVTGVCAIDVLRQAGRPPVIRAGGRVGGPAGMLTSTDGGRTFIGEDMSRWTGMILDVHFLDANTGFVAGASASNEAKAHARILKTTDGGRTWRSVFESHLAGDNNWKLAFPSRSVGYATIISYGAPAAEARGYVVKTVDGGEHWTPLTVTRDHGFIPYGVAFLDERRGWVGGSDGGFETRDGGATWTRGAFGASTNKFAFTRRADGGTDVYAIGHDLYRLSFPPTPAFAAARKAP